MVAAATGVTAQTLTTLVFIALAAVLAPLLSELTGRLAVPEIVIQIGFGILLGPYVFNLAHVGNVITGLSDLGLTYLIFLAGYELDLNRIRGKPLELAATGWGISLVIGMATAFALVSAGLARDTVVVGLALTTTALGTLVPILNDAGVMPTRFGSYISAIGTVGEFGPIVAVALLLTNKEPVITSLLLLLFVVVAVVTVLVAARRVWSRCSTVTWSRAPSYPCGSPFSSSFCWFCWPRCSGLTSCSELSPPASSFAFSPPGGRPPLSRPSSKPSASVS
jgi:Kef-type K+ transport system membrane component KefB